MPARKNDVPTPTVAKPKKRPVKRKPNDVAPVPEVRDNRGVGLSGG